MVKKRKMRKGLVLTIAVLLVAVVSLLIVLILNFNIHFIGKKSVHENAKSYSTRDSLVFYPDADGALAIAKDVSSRAIKDSINDYALVPYGDYYQVSYSDGTKYYIDHNNKMLEIKAVNEDGKMILSDYLRYSMKKAEIDEAYTLDFLEESYYENIDISQVSYKIDGTDLLCYFPKYEHEVAIPLKYMQNVVGINLGYENEDYVKPRYVSKNRKVICFTFDDGPDTTSEVLTSNKAIEYLYRYDSSATFFVCGYRIGNKAIELCKKGASLGMEYGSHTQSHPTLTNLSSDSIYEEIMIPYNDLYNGFGYVMNCYRPPGGARNEYVDDASPLGAVIWSVDSLDWKLRLSYDYDDCIEAIKDQVINQSGAEDGDIVLFHDIYLTSVDSAIELARYFINEGYQVVNVAELCQHFDIDNFTVLYNGKSFR